MSAHSFPPLSLVCSCGAKAMSHQQGEETPKLSVLATCGETGEIMKKQER